MGGYWNITYTYVHVCLSAMVRNVFGSALFVDQHILTEQCYIAKEINFLKFCIELIQ
jgi:hypothetical protein